MSSDGAGRPPKPVGINLPSPPVQRRRPTVNEQIDAMIARHLATNGLDSAKEPTVEPAAEPATEPTRAVQKDIETIIARHMAANGFAAVAASSTDAPLGAGGPGRRRAGAGTGRFMRVQRPRGEP